MNSVFIILSIPNHSSLVLAICYISDLNHGSKNKKYDIKIKEKNNIVTALMNKHLLI